MSILLVAVLGCLALGIPLIIDEWTEIRKFEEDLYGELRRVMLRRLMYVSIYVAGAMLFAIFLSRFIPTYLASVIVVGFIGGFALSIAATLERRLKGARR